MRFYGSMTNSRGREVTAGGAGDAHIRGWNAGVLVYAGPGKDDRDSFTVYMSTGSSRSGREVLIGTVTDTPDGPAFTPADKSTQRSWKPAPKPRERKPWTYKGVNVHPDDGRNGCGVRWWAWGSATPTLRAATKADMRELITADLAEDISA